MFKPSPKALALAVASALSATTTFADEVDSAAVEGTAQDLEVIVISGTRTKKALKDVAGSISVIGQEDIEKQVVSDMNQLFKYDPSVKVTGGLGEAQNIVVRGMGSDRVLMIKDGMRMNEGYGANGLNDIVGRGFIDTDTLKQVEVAKGAASSLYGSDALGGIVVFTTKDASDYLSEGESFAGKVKFGYNDNSSQSNFGATLALMTGDVEHLLNLSYRTGEEEQNYHESESPFDIDTESVLYKGKYNINDTDFVSFTADIYKQENKGDSANGLLAYFRGLAAYGYVVDTENSTTEKDNQSFKVSYYSETATAIYDMLNVNVYTNKTEQVDSEYALMDINAPMFGVVEMRDMFKDSTYEQETVGFLSNASIQLNDTHTLGYGLDIEKSESKRYEHKLYSVEGTPKPGYPQETEKFPTTDTFRAGFFINDEIALMDGKLTVTPGVRFDTYEMEPENAVKSDGEPFKKFDESHTSLNIGALYRFSPTLSGFAQYGQGFKVPAYDLAYIEHYNQASSDYIYEIIPSDDLVPEESDTFELGLRGHVGDIAFTSAIFYNKYDNFLETALVNSEFVQDGFGNNVLKQTFQYQNIDAVTIKGWEFGMTYYMDSQWSLFANAAYQHGKDDETDDYISSISPLSGIAGVAYDGEKLSSEVILNWAQRMDKVNEGSAEVAGYASIDWLVNYEVTNELVVNLAVNNVLDREYVPYSNAASHAQSDSLAHLTAPGRTIAASVHYSF